MSKPNATVQLYKIGLTSQTRRWYIYMQFPSLTDDLDLVNKWSCILYAFIVDLLDLNINDH